MSGENNAKIYPLRLHPEGFKSLLEMTDKELAQLIRNLIKWRSGKPYTEPTGLMGFAFATTVAANEREDGRIKQASERGSVRSERKAETARENGLKGGRRRKAGNPTGTQWNPTETQQKPNKTQQEPNSNTNTKSNTNTVPLPFARASEDGDGDGDGCFALPGGNGSVVALARKFADAVKADRDNGGEAFFDPAHDPAAMMVAITGDTKSIRRWRQLAAGIPDADLRQELFTAYREISCGEEPHNRAAALNARLGKMLEASTHNGENAPEAEVV